MLTNWNTIFLVKNTLLMRPYLVLMKITIQKCLWEIATTYIISCSSCQNKIGSYCLAMLLVLQIAETNFMERTSWIKRNFCFCPISAFKYISGYRRRFIHLILFSNASTFTPYIAIIAYWSWHQIDNYTTPLNIITMSC